MVSSSRLCCCLLALTAAAVAAAVYTDDDDVAELVSTLVWLFLINLLAGGFTQALRGILNGCGQQVVNARISLICGWVIGMPISAALCYGIGPFPAMGVVGAPQTNICDKSSKSRRKIS